ncbi:hypothetical protein GT037_000922 [Alternaria burnsii]|uniref:Uncharacterized protein n=1 Tax=Alternaria burnsii TaxID=1187904 RepID=A0A8H7BH07_9PLEO|nr:uncharacterized protein GT037_000922 [Alternaria burnsii]KAF7681946.1 hypothetical protein GT037_000922 [Alternaria burnsii]CAI9635863.1 unnamed protein product [Alternaria burnsii]
MAPKEVVRARPAGYVTLLLKLGDNLEFRWALTTEMSDYDPFVPFRHKEIVGNTPGLGNAYEMANNALEASLGLDYWREQVTNTTSDAEYSESGATGSDGDTCSEPEMRKALRLSREKFYDKQSKEETVRNAKLPTPSISPHTPARGLGYQRTFFDKTLSGLDRGRREPISDAVEGEILQSKDFVQVLVGPNSQVSTLQKESIWNRPYFRDPRFGINLFDHNDDGIWNLQHPALVEIDPEDFVFAAEYLESGGFGYRYPQDGGEMEEAFAQCVSAWFTAEKLGMSDMMDHVVEKLEGCIEPEMQDVLVFAYQVYVSQNTALPSQVRLKDYLAMCIAENWWIYLDDDNLSSDFIEKVKRLPELERDIYQRRLPALLERLSGDQEDSETETD